MKTGITFSTFDLLHAGHIAMLSETLVERYAQLNALKFVDEIVPYQTEQDVIDILELFQLDVRFLGEEYKHDDFSGKDVCQKRGIALHFNRRDHRFSSSDLRKRVAASAR